MTEAISGIVQQVVQQSVSNQQTGQTAAGGKTRSFESYLNQNDKPNNTEPTGTGNQTLQQKVDDIQNALSGKLQNIGNVNKDPGAIPTELLDSKSRMGFLREAYDKLGSDKAASGFQGKFLQVESDYKQVEAIMTSDKNLSPGELLALQARLYQVSQHIEVMSKVVDQMAGGIKTVLNTNV